MDFARKQLEKYGWSDGKGLGKNENGISQPLKPKLKRSITGVGYDAAADLTEQWWSALYNKAANNIEVEEKNGKTKKIKTNEEFEITNSIWKLKNKKKKDNDVPEVEYVDHFVKTAVLTNGGSKMQTVRESNSEEEDIHVSEMTDEQLFAACEGRTAHKGARHGLKALGKLARIEQHEKLLLLQSKYNGYSHKKHKSKINEVVEEINLDTDNDVPMKKKKKKKHNCNFDKNICVEGIVDVLEIKKKNVNNRNKIISKDSKESIDGEEIEVIAKSIKNKKKHALDNCISISEKLESTEIVKKRKKIK